MASYTIWMETTLGSYESLGIQSLCRKISFSRQLSDAYSPLVADEAIFEFMNDGAELNSLFLAGTTVGRRISLSAFDGSTLHKLYTGRIKSITARPDLINRNFVVEALTDTMLLDKTQITTPLYKNIPIASLFTEVMTRVPGVASYHIDMVYDAITDVAGFAWFSDRVASGVLRQLIDSGRYKAYVDGSGIFRLKSRYWGDFASSVNTLETQMQDFLYELTDETVVNKASVAARQVLQSTDVATIAWLPGVVSIPASGSVGFFLGFVDPRNLLPTAIGSAIAQVASQDYYASANSDGTGSNYTSTLSVSMSVFGASAVASVFNGTGATAWLSRFQIRGYPLLNGSPITAKYQDNSSQNVYGLSEAVVNECLITDGTYLRGVVEQIVKQKKDPSDRIRITMNNEMSITGAPNQLLFQVGDILSVINSFTGVNSTWQIRRLAHEIDLSVGVRHRATFSLERAAQRPWLVLGHATRGILTGDRQLAL